MPALRGNVHGIGVRGARADGALQGPLSPPRTTKLSGSRADSIGVLNLTTLLLARTIRQAREGAVRLALGASCERLAFASTVEGGSLALLGAVAGLGVAKGLLGGLP